MSLEMGRVLEAACVVGNRSGLRILIICEMEDRIYDGINTSSAMKIRFTVELLCHRTEGAIIDHLTLQSFRYIIINLVTLLNDFIRCRLFRVLRMLLSNRSVLTEETLLCV